MGYIPKNAKWYLADIVEEIFIEDDPQNVVHINTVLIRADSPEEAYTKAMELGKEGEHTYENTDDKQVKLTFRRLRNLDVIHDELEHGTELFYDEQIGVDNAEIERMLRPKEQLGVFRPIQESGGPNYMPKSVAEDLLEYELIETFHEKAFRKLMRAKARKCEPMK